ncbi:hypothetical protein [Agromyces ramosus]|uniref:hypothetical protein n=1 Tax=Agromyces ramosus TaxID=33879 RepID=UPI0027D86417|nr:hypothetical protein [Agromyces ramosus]
MIRHLPIGPDDVLTVERVERFVKETKRKPDVRLAVLGTLRAHAVNGAEVPLAGAGTFFAALALFLTAVVGPSVPAGWLWLLWLGWGVAVTIAAFWVVRVSFAAHTRRVTATTWLGAYEDSLKN